MMKLLGAAAALACMMVATSVMADPSTKSSIRWTAFVTPAGSSGGVVTYAVSTTVRTVVPVPGAGWFCAVAAPTRGADDHGAYESALLLCATADGHSSGIRAECRVGVGQQLAQMSVGSPPGSQDYILGLGCSPPPTAPPNEKNL